MPERRRASQSRYAADGVGGLAFEGEGVHVQVALVELAGILRHTANAGQAISDVFKGKRERCRHGIETNGAPMRIHPKGCKPP